VRKIDGVLSIVVVFRIAGDHIRLRLRGTQQIDKETAALPSSDEGPRSRSGGAPAGAA
jgi:hypothetical protein